MRYRGDADGLGKPCYLSRMRPGAALVEMALVLPILILLMIGLLVFGLGVFRYQQVAAVAREGARYASVHGAQYQSETGKTAATPQDVYNQAILPMAAGLDPAALSYSVTWNKSNWPVYADPNSVPPGQPVGNTVIVTVNYLWIPEAFFGGITLTSRAEMPMSY